LPKPAFITAARLADRIDAAHHHVLHEHRVEVVAPADRLEGRHGQVHRRHLVQGSVGFAAPARGADRIVDKSFSH
jgi:hypothetical protein